MERYIIVPCKDPLLADYTNFFYAYASTNCQKIFNRMRIGKEKQTYQELTTMYQANDFEGLRLMIDYNTIYAEARVRFEHYLDKVLVSFGELESVGESLDYEIRLSKPGRPWNDVVTEAVPMKEAEFFASAQKRYETAITTVKAAIENNLRITKKAKLFLNECINYIEFTTQDRFFLMRALDYLHSFKGNGKETSNINRLTILLYCLYDLLSTKEMYLRVNTKYARQIIEPKQRKRPLYLLIRFSPRDPNPYVSNYICEFLLQLIEKGVLRCSSLAKAFLLSPDERVFYKYCLINGKICLKRLKENTTVRV